MSATGYIQVHAYESYAQIPLQNVAITVRSPDGTAVAMRLTDRSGRIEPVALPVPDLSASQTPDTGEPPFALVDILARLPGYEQIEAEDVQVFPGTTTNQELELIPLSELPGAWDQLERFDTPPQNL